MIALVLRQQGLALRSALFAEADDLGRTGFAGDFNRRMTGASAGASRVVDHTPHTFDDGLEMPRLKVELPDYFGFKDVQLRA